MGLVKLDRRTVIKLILLTLILTTIVIIGIRIAPWLYETSKNPQRVVSHIIVL